MALFYYVYRLTCDAPECWPAKYYYGSRGSNVLPEEDAYWSSSRYVRVAMKTYGRQSFRKKVLAVYSTRHQALDHEIRLHARFNVKNHPAFFNRSNQTSTGFVGVGGAKGIGARKPMSEAQKQVLREALQGRPISPEQLATRFGRKHSPETRARIAAALRRAHDSQNGTSVLWTEEMRQAARERQVRRSRDTK